jgi:antiviral helicase SKI2
MVLTQEKTRAQLAALYTDSDSSSDYTSDEEGGDLSVQISRAVFPPPKPAPSDSDPVPIAPPFVPQVDTTKGSDESQPPIIRKIWAKVDTRVIGKLTDIVPYPAIEYPFELDDFQKRAVVRIEKNESVFVAAHTSAGKTAIAEYAIAKSIRDGGRAIYTSPVKALSNQKYRDFKLKFGADNVGIVTGDVKLEPTAPCVIMTTEILRNLIYKNDTYLSTVQYVIYDEIHYINDTERGVVWEESIISLPVGISLVMLSATVPNFLDFASWVGRTRNQVIHCVSTEYRPVPLNHYLFADTKETLIPLTIGGEFNTNAYKSIYEEQKQKQPKVDPKKKEYYRPTPSGDAKLRTEISKLQKLISHLNEQDKLPATVFVFSRKRCEILANGISVDLLNSSEKSQVHLFIKETIASLSDSDQGLPQIQMVTELALRGIGVHHGGMLPLMKETIEMLLQRGLVKIFFATETVAQGLNMPTRTVVLSSLRKHDGNTFRELYPEEFTQMSGRAGRRGLDNAGTVIVFAPSADSLPDLQALTKAMTRKSNKLQSQFRLTFQMLLQVYRREHLRVEDLMSRSFLETARAAIVPTATRNIQRINRRLADEIPSTIECIIGDPEIEDFYKTETHAIYRCSSVWKNMALIKEYLRVGTVVTAKIITGQPLLDCIISAVLPGAKFTVIAKVPVNFTCDELHVIQTTPVVLVRSEIESTQIFSVHENIKFPLMSDSAMEKFFSDALSSRSSSTPPVIPRGFQDVDIMQRFDEMKSVFSALGANKCKNCIKLPEHYSIIHKREELIRERSFLEYQLTDSSLVLEPQRIAKEKALIDLGFIDRNSHALTIKGKMGVEILSSDEITLVEILLNNELDTDDLAMIAAFVSAFVAGGEGCPELEPSVAKKVLPEEMVSKMHAVAAIHYNNIGSVLRNQKIQVDWNEFEKQLNFGMAPVVYAWSNGMPFADIMSNENLIKPGGNRESELQEGSIVRAIVRTDELLRKISEALVMISNKSMADRIDKCREKFRRDIIFAKSLYLQ